MISDDVLQRKMGDLPEPVLDYLYSERAGELNADIIERNGLSEGQESVFFRILRETFVRELSMDRLVSELKARLIIDDAKAKALATDIAGYRLLPLDKWLGDVTGYLRSLGADPQKYPPFRVQILERTRDEAADDVLEASTAATQPPHLKARLRNLVESYLAGIRTEAQLKEALLRDEKIGGLGLDEASAERVMLEAKDEARSVVIREEIPPAPAAAPVAAPQAPAAPQKAESLMFTKDDEDEVAQFAPLAPAPDVSRAVEEIYAASGLATADEAMAKRIKSVIGNRLRDVRDQMETLEIMTQPKELGGLNMGQEAARSLLSVIQAKMRRETDAQKIKAKNEKTQWVETEQRQKALNEALSGAEQKTEIDDLYQSIVMKSRKAAAKAAPRPAPAAPPSAATAAPAPLNLPIANANPVPPEYRPAPEPAIMPISELPRPATPPPATLVKPLRGAAPAPAVPDAFMQRPKLEDVKAPPKLTGPVEELRAITITDFRRLSKDPKEACEKVKSKIDLLAEQSYTRRSEGIAAWNSSEVVRTYLELMQAGLNGLSVIDAIAVREGTGKPTLAAEEFRAVADLMRQIRY